MSTRAGELRPESNINVQETAFSVNPAEPTRETTRITGAPELPREHNESLLAANEDAQEQGYNYGSISPNLVEPPALASSSTSEASSITRAVAPDLLRGLLMALQAVDHSALMLGAWEHGVAIESESDGTLVHKWNHPTAWTARMLTHACAPGFTFLLGMGIVYFVRSRSKLGWSAGRMARHFVVRAAALAIVNEVFFTLLFGRGRFWIINIVLLALAVDYFLAGIGYLAINFSEEMFAHVLASFIPRGSTREESSPLLREHASQFRTDDDDGLSTTVKSISWHFHNCVIGALVVVSIGWNHWLSVDQGRCHEESLYSTELKGDFILAGPTSTWFDFWFYPTTTEKVMSPFPPLAWLSFAVLGILYGRIVLARAWSSRAVNLGNMLAGLLFLLFFVLTRLLHFGNLSEDCLHMPEQQAHPDRNQYLASFRSFLYIVKYPPSGAFLALTMAFNFFFLSLFGAIPRKAATRIPGLMVFGTSALFFYVLHLMLYVALSIPVKSWFGHELGGTDPISGMPAVGVGDTPVFWLTWLLGLVILYPLCRWYGRFKSKKGANSIWRFF